MKARRFVPTDPAAGRRGAASSPKRGHDGHRPAARSRVLVEASPLAALGVRSLIAGLGALLALLLLAGPAWAAEGGSDAGTAGAMIAAAALLGPLGLSPFLALAAFGAAELVGLHPLPTGLGGFGHPVVIALMAGLGVALHLGRSSKLTKPLAEAAGLGESVFALVVALAAALPLATGSSGGPAQAGVLGAMVFALAAVSCVLALVILRTALDVMIWLSPFPFVDGLFQTAKLMVTAVLVGSAILYPPAAVVLNVVILLATFVFVRWAIRTARFGLTIAYDLTLGRGQLEGLPRDELVPTDLGAMRCFVLEAPGFARRSASELELRAGRWFLVPPGRDAVPLVDGERSVLRPVWSGLELSAGDARILLPPRYRPLEADLRATSGAALAAPASTRSLPGRVAPSTL